MSNEIVSDKDDDPEVVAIVVALADGMKNWICRHCGEPVLREKQVSRAVYALPCGHRLRLGKTRGERPKELEAGQVGLMQISP